MSPPLFEWAIYLCSIEAIAFVILTIYHLRRTLREATATHHIEIQIDHPGS